MRDYYCKRCRKWPVGHGQALCQRCYRELLDKLGIRERAKRIEAIASAKLAEGKE